LKRFFGVIAVGILLASLSACSSQSGPVSGSEITIGFEQPINSLNTDIQGTSQVVSSDLANLINASFYSVAADGNLVANPDFGTVEVVSQKPFTVKYSLSGKATWSDGSKVSATDLLLSWAAATGFGGNDFKSIRMENGFRYTTEQPTIGDKDLSLTIKFNQPVPDYKTALTLSVSASDLAKHAFGSSNLNSKQAAARVLEAITAPNPGDLQALAKSYRNGFKLGSATSSKSSAIVSSGAYVVTKADSTGLTLKINPKNTWMPVGRAETIKLTSYDDALAAVEALKAGEIDLAGLIPSATSSYSSIVASLQAARSVENQVIASNEVEAVTFNQAEGSVFYSAAFGQAGSTTANQAALEARQAFLNVISVSKIRTLIGANQTIQNADSLVFAPQSAYYQASTQDSGILSYQFADAEKAYNTIKKLDVRMHVRVLFDSSNPRAQTEYSVIADLAGPAGFSLSNVSSDNVSAALQNGEYDVYLAPQRVLSDPSLSLQQGFYFAKGFPSNSNLLSLMQEYGQATTAVGEAAVLKKLDAELISQAYGLPLYQLPTIFTSSKKFSKKPVSADGLSLTSGYASWNLATK